MQLSELGIGALVRRGFALLLLMAASPGCGGEPIIVCDAANEIQPFCGFKNPEDLVRPAAF